MITNKDVIMPLDVPRRASFDDLREGQKVAWLATDPEELHAGRVGRVAASTLVFYDSHGGQWHTPRSAVERGEVVILEDAPASPVTVRREDYDALVDWLTNPHDGAHQNPVLDVDRIHNAVRALIDNADLGAGS